MRLILSVLSVCVAIVQEDVADDDDDDNADDGEDFNDEHEITDRDREVDVAPELAGNEIGEQPRDNVRTVVVLAVLIMGVFAVVRSRAGGAVTAAVGVVARIAGL